MTYYLIQATYEPEAWARFVQNPEDRREAFRALAEGNGGTFIDSWLSFSEYDLVALFEMPDNVRTLSGNMAAMSSGAIRSMKTTPLMTWEEGLEAMRGASDAAYRPPGSG